MEKVLESESKQKMPLLANFELKAIAKGEAEGIEIAESKGKLEKETEIVLRMHSKGLSVDEIADLTGLSVAQIAAIVQQAAQLRM